MDTQTIILTIIGAVFASQGFWSWLQSRSEKKSAATRLTMGLGYAKIRSLGEEYLERGSITTEEFRDLNKYLYEPYKELGGNGAAEKIMDDVKRLPIKEG